MSGWLIFLIILVVLIALAILANFKDLLRYMKIRSM